MSINPVIQYPTQVGAATVPYPYGVAQNITLPGDNTGTPWEAALVNDVFGFQQALLKSGGIVPSGTPDAVGASQYLQAMIELASGRAFTYDDTGLVNAYVLTPRTDLLAPASYYDGMVVRFKPVISNTTASTIDVNGLGVKNTISLRTGLPLDAGDIVAGVEIELIYDGTDFTLKQTSIVHSGQVSDIGVIGNNTGDFDGVTLTAVRNSIGFYTVSHPYGVTDFTPIVVGDAVSDVIAVASAISNFSFDVRIRNSGGTLIDAPFYFLINAWS